MFQKTLHQIRALHALRVGRPVVHFGGRHQLAALRHARDEGGLQIGARRINGSGVTGRAGADNQNFGMLQCTHDDARKLKL